ncbi:hypothetical protein SDC9_70048 [bioreactor metagenome]|uniref:Uncharacterized protein n=1 Tax=bioreactor metagenome TaxID=1076179 RepID=A0A644YBS3_9ZZZZ
MSPQHHDQHLRCRAVPASVRPGTPRSWPGRLPGQWATGPDPDQQPRPARPDRPSRQDPCRLALPPGPPRPLAVAHPVRPRLRGRQLGRPGPGPSGAAPLPHRARAAALPRPGPFGPAGLTLISRGGRTAEVRAPGPGTAGTCRAARLPRP